MKKYLFIFLSIIIGVTLSSCNQDLLEIDQQSVLAATSTYENADDATVESFISAIYAQVRGTAGFGVNMNAIRVCMEAMSDNSLNGNNVSDNATSYGAMQEYTSSPENGMYQTYWSYYYTTIYWCNMIIENIPNNTIASDAIKSRIIAEARAIRAIQMMYLVQLWGNPPLGDHIMQGDEGNTPAAESWSFIETELAAAAEGLPSKSGKDGQSEIGGRLTKEAVYAYLGKAYLWQAKYSEAANTLYNKVINTGLYELIPDFEDLNLSDADFSSEYVWEYNFSEDPTYMTSQGGRMLAVFFGWRFEKIQLPDQMFVEQGWGFGSSPSGDFGSFMEAHDMVGGVQTPRFRGTLVSYEDLFDNTRFTYDLSSVGHGGVIAPPVENNQGYFKIKNSPLRANMVGTTASSFSNIYIHNNLAFMRYAEVLLNYAEAVAMGGSNGATLSGLQALNLVRDRAGLGAAPSLDMDNETYGVKAERRAELFDENTRWIDLVRWGDAATVLQDRGKTRYFFYGYENGLTDGAQSKDQWRITITSSGGNGFQSKHNLFAYPEIELNNNHNIDQNPGWE